MSHDPTDIWDGDSDTADSYPYMSSIDMVSNYIDMETQEWTNEDTAKTTQCIQMLENIVKGQFSTSDDVELSPFFLRSDGIDSPSFRRPNGSAVNQSQQTAQQYAHAIDDYEPFEGKDSIFDDVASGRNSRPSLSRENSANAYLAHDSRPPKSPATNRNDIDPFEPQFVKSRGKGIIDPHLSETVERASSKLRKFQRKIIRTIENSPEEVTMQMLLELNESLLSVLSKADVVIAAPGHPSQADFPTMVTIMYMLRRGNRMETLTAVKQLTMLCCGAESYVDTATKVVVKATTMKEMRAAGALQTLMTALVRCVALDWSEVEMQICRVISVLVTYEEDWMLLLKNSLEILTALQSLLIKVVRTKHPASSPRSRSQGFGKGHTCCDVNSLVAAALAKLSLVLCADWGKSAAPSASPHVFVASTRLTEVERAREVLRNSANRHAPKPPLKSQTDPSKTLEIVLTIILTICEGAMVFPPASVLASVTLGDVTQGRGDLTISGAFSRSLPLLSNSSAVLCSIALCNLAECPPCVAVLVQGGALRLLRCWLELGTDLMTGLWDALQKERSAGADSSDSKPISKLLRSKEYVQSFELLTNAAAAVHYLVGGSDIPGDKNLPATDSTAGFIYAQVMAEGLPGALVRLISASVRDFTGAYEGDRTPTTPSMSSEKYPAPTLAGYNIDTDRDNAELLHLMQMLTVPAASAGVGSKDKDKGSSRRPLIHILPRAAEVHLAQALYHLSNRVQSRAHLQAVGAPFALCRLFVSATERTKRKNVRYPAYLGGTSGKGDEPSSGNSAASEKDKKISNKTSFYWDEEDEDDDEFYDRVPLTPQTYSCNDLKGVGVAAGVSTTTGTNNGGGECTDGMGNDYFAKAILQLSLEKSCCQTPLHNSDTRQPKGAVPQPQDEALANHDLMYLKTIVSSCLDALTNFLADDLALKLRCGSHSAADEPGKTVLLGPSFVNFATSPRLSLPEIMGNRCVVEALKISISCLPQGLARLAALRTVGALTDWPLALAGMIDQGITMELVQICQERYTDSTLSHNGQAASIVTPRQAKRGSSFVSFFQGPSPRISGSTSASAGSGSTSERTTANAYNTASSTPNYSTPRTMKMARSISSDSDQGCLDTEYSYSNGRHCSTGGDQSPVNCLISNSIINHSLCDNPPHPTAGVAKKDYTGDSRLGGPSPSALRRPSCGVEAAFSPELMVEETMCICFALANAATYSNECAVQLFNMGLMSVMLRIATSTNLEIVRQALKCVGAMCLVRNSQTSLAATSDQRHNDTKLKQLRTHTYVRALGALTDALSSPSSLVQLEAVRGIANIAGVDEQMCDQAVAKSLRTIISMLLDSSCDRDTRNAAEDVLKAVGFTGGMRDLEVCQFDVELLGEWFTIKKSMPPQMLARRLVSHWIEDLFNGAQPVPVVINSSTAHSTTPSQVPCPLLSWTSSAPSSASNSRSGSPILGRSQMFWNGPMGNTTSSGGQISSRGFKSEKTLLQTAKTELQRRFSDSISKFVPFCMGGSAARVLREEEEEDQEMREIGLDLFSPSAGSNTSNPYGLYEGMDCPPDGVVNLMDIFYASHLQQVLLMDIVYFLSDPVLESLIAWNESDGYENSVEEINSYDSDYDHDNDVELLRTQQGLRHIGPKGDFDRTSARLSLPIPFSLNALLLPMRCYVTFTRVGRVIERIVEQGGDLQPFSLVFRDSQLSGDTHASLLSTLRRCGRIVTISFANYKSVEIDRDSRMGWLVGNLPPSIRFVSLRNIVGTESIQTLCILLRKQNLSFLEAPQSYPWSYSNPCPIHPMHSAPSASSGLLKELQEDISAALLPGRACHPLGLQGIAITHCTVTQADIKYICDLLEPVTIVRRSSNTPRDRDKEKDKDDSSNSSRDTSSSKNAAGRPRGLRYLDLGFNRMGCANCSEVLRAAARGNLECLDLAGNFSHRGGPFLAAIVETLTANSPVNNLAGRGGGDNDDYSSDGGSDDGNNNNSNYSNSNSSSSSSGGNSKATMKSLCGTQRTPRNTTNSPHDTLSLHLPKHIPLQYTCHLKHLGISYNNLSGRVFCGILSCLQRNSSLGSLDVSHNSLKHSAHVKESLRQFLRHNKGIRTLDLSHNKFTAETTNVLHLGLLENDVLLLLPLIGNSSAERSAELSLVQNKLRENRVRYKAQIDLFNSQADEQEKNQKVRRRVEERRLAAQAALDDDPKESSSPTREPSPSDNDPSKSSSVQSPLHPAELVLTKGLSVQFAVAASTIPSNSPPEWGSNSEDEEHAEEGMRNVLLPDDVEASDEDLSKESVTFGKFIAIKETSIVRTARSQNEQTVATSSPRTMPLPVSLTLPATLPNGIADFTTPSPGSFNIELSQIRRTSSLLRPKSMGHILDKQLGGKLIQAIPSKEIRKVKKENYVLNVLFSAPLAWRDRSNRLHPLEMLDYGAERDALSHVFREVQRDISVIYDFATTDALRTALSFGCRALHFSGHGHESHLNFEDGRSGLQLVNVDTLRSLLSAGGLRLDFVFVSACHSKPTGQAFVDAGVKHVVCVKIDAMIQDNSAMAFTRAFYLALLSGQTVKHSFLIAKEALKASPCIADSVLEGEKFVLLPENDPHDVPIFQSCHVVEWVAPTYGNAHIPSPPPDFEGREVDMHRIITTLLARRLVSVVGALGQGKSSLTAAVVTYMNDRKTMFEDGIVYLKPHASKKLSSHRSFLSALLAAIISGPTAVAARLQERQKENPGGDLAVRNMNIAGTLSRDSSADKDDLARRASIGKSDRELPGGGEPDPVYLTEELIVSALSPFKLLLVLDHIEGLLTNTVTDTATDLKFFLGRLFERCRHVKVLVVAGEAMGMGQVSGFGVVENTVSVGPLSLRSSLRLFARLAPALSTSQRKASFVSSLMPAKPDVTVHCRELTICSMKLLALFGNGNPSSIVKLACESTLESVEKLMAEGVDIISSIEGSAGGEVRRRTVSATPQYNLPSSNPVSRSEQTMSPTSIK